MTAVTDYGFTGQKLDASDGLMYYGARYYDAALGRFISADTIVPNPANPQSLNRYAYVLNNPVKYVDPSGHCPIDADTGGCERDDNENVIFTVDQEIYGEPPPDESVDSCHSAECWGSDPSKAKPGLTPDQKKLVKNLQDLAYVANLSSVSASSIGVIVELVACEGGPIGCAVGLAAYQPLNTYETVLGWAAFGLTTWADNVKGNTYVNFQTGEVSIGQDTAAAGFTATIGTFTGEAVTDSVVNWAGVGYSTASYMGWVPDFGPIKFSFK